MQYEEVVARVQERIRATTPAEAVAAIRATLETLSERLAALEDKTFDSELPDEIGDYLRHVWNGEGELFSLHEFYRRVSVRENVPLPKGLYHARAVMAVLQACAPDDIERVRARLPEDYEGLFEGPRDAEESTSFSSSTVADVETKHPEVIAPDAPIVEAAQKMKRLDIGALPVCDAGEIIGMLTDRDITVRATAEGRDPRRTTVRDVMTHEVVYCYEDQQIEEAATLMENRQIRRLPVIDRDCCLVGMVSLGDIAVRNHNERLVGEILERVSEHTEVLAKA